MNRYTIHWVTGGKVPNQPKDGFASAEQANDYGLRVLRINPDKFYVRSC